MRREASPYASSEMWPRSRASMQPLHFVRTVGRSWTPPLVRRRELPAGMALIPEWTRAWLWGRGRSLALLSEVARQEGRLPPQGHRSEARRECVLTAIQEPVKGVPQASTVCEAKARLRQIHGGDVGEGDGDHAQRPQKGTFAHGRSIGRTLPPQAAFPRSQSPSGFSTLDLAAASLPIKSGGRSRVVRRDFALFPVASPDQPSVVDHPSCFGPSSFKSNVKIHPCESRIGPPIADGRPSYAVTSGSLLTPSLLAAITLARERHSRSVERLGRRGTSITSFPLRRSMEGSGVLAIPASLGPT